MSIDVNQEAQDLVERLEDEYADDVTVEDVEEKIQSFVDFGVTGDEAVQGAVSKLSNELDASRGELFGESDSDEQQGDADFVSIADINSEDEWVSLNAQVTHLWDNDSDSISQVGVLDDGSSSIKFVAWSKSDVPLFTEGETYDLLNVVTRKEEYDGETRMAVHLNSATEVEMSESEVTPSTEEQTITGALLSLQSGSGLIERDEDGQVVDSDYEGETENDLRIRAVFDTGDSVYTVYLGQEITEAITGITLEEAKSMARDALDRSVVQDEMEPMLVGKYFTVTGNIRGDAIFASEFEESGPVDADVDNLLVRARSL